MKFHSCILIHLGGRNQVELVRGDGAVMLIPDIERGPGQDVVMNLLRRAAIFEDQRHSFLAGRDRRGAGHIEGGLVRAKLPLVRWLCVVSARSIVGSITTRRGGRIVVTAVVRVPREIRTPSIAGNDVGNSRSIRRLIRPSITQVSGIGRARVAIAGGISLVAPGLVAPALIAPGYAGRSAGGKATIP